MTDIKITSKLHTSNWTIIIKLASISAFLQLIFQIGYIPFGPIDKKGFNNAAEYYNVINNDGLLGLLKLDWSTLVFIGLAFVMMLALYAIFKHNYESYSLLAMFLTTIVTAVCFATNSIFSMVHLSQKYQVATTDAAREQLLAAGEAIIASDSWRSTGGFLMILSQISFIIISVVMLHHIQHNQNTAFRPITVYSGLLATGIDVIQHLIGLISPDIAYLVLVIAGIFYLVWFVVLGIDLWKYSSHNIVLTGETNE